MGGEISENGDYLMLFGFILEFKNTLPHKRSVNVKVEYEKHSVNLRWVRLLTIHKNTVAWATKRGFTFYFLLACD